ncbi:hypothetical protein N0V88_002542 [Collariella sp. IMI 366227]|nr:hypothetical protein N0V88_002542 [Collariella sp. IMI 366227]
MTGLTLQSAIKGAPDAVAVIVPSQPQALTVTYKDLVSEVSSFQRKLAAIGIAKGAPVSIATVNSYEFIVSFLAASWQRAIAAPLNPAYKQDEFEFYIDDVKSAIVLVPRGAYHAASPAVKAAQKFNAAIAECYWDPAKKEVALDVKELAHLPTHPADRTMLVMPLFHVHGLLCGLLAPLLSGGSMIVPPNSPPPTSGATSPPTTPPGTRRSPPSTKSSSKPRPSRAPHPLHPLLLLPSLPTVFHALEAAYRAPVLEAYAMTEAAHQMTSNPLPSVGPRKPGTVGIGQGVEVSILSESGSPVPQGGKARSASAGRTSRRVSEQPEANATAFHKGLDQDGYVVITGRIKELINKGGEKISPIELDNVLARHPAVAEAVSFAVPDEMYGQEVAVAVVLKPGVRLGRGVEGVGGEKLARFKVPKKVYFTDIMPKTATGKIQRRIVAETMQKQEARAKL